MIKRAFIKYKLIPYKIVIYTESKQYLKKGIFIFLNENQAFRSRFFKEIAAIIRLSKVKTDPIIKGAPGK